MLVAQRRRDPPEEHRREPALSRPAPNEARTFSLFRILTHSLPLRRCAMTFSNQHAPSSRKTNSPRRLPFNTKSNVSRKTDRCITVFSRVERVTRYSLKVKSGEIAPYVPRWERNLPRKKGQPSKWTILYQNNANPYQRVYKDRVRK